MAPAFDLSLRTKLALSFGAALALVIAVGLVGILQMRAVSGTVIELRDGSLPRFERVSEIKRSIAQYRSLAARQTDTADYRQLADINRAAQTARRSVEDASAAYILLAPTGEEQRVLLEFTRAWQQYEAARASALAHLELGERTTTLRELRTIADPAFETAAARLDELMLLAKEEGAQAVLRAQQRYDDAVRLTLAIGLVAAFGAAAGVVWVTRTISRPLLQVSDAMSRLARGDLTATIAASERRDEIGTLFAAARGYRDSLERILDLSDRSDTDRRRFEAALSNMSEGLCMVDAEQRLIVCNPRFAALFAVPAHLTAPGTPLAAIVAAVADPLRACIRVGRDDRLPPVFEALHPDGTAIEVRTVRLPDGGVLRTYTDITAGRKAEVELRQSEERYRALVTASASIVWQAAPDGAILDGIGWEDFTGQPLHSGRGFGWLQAVHPDDRERTLTRWSEVLESGLSGENRYRIRRRDGAYRWCVGRAAPLKNPDGSIREWVGTIVDIHEHKTAQAILMETNQLLGSALRAGRMEAWDWDLESGTVTRSDTSIEVIGLPTGSIGGFLDRIHEEDRAAYHAAFQEAVQGSGAYEVEFRYHRSEGETVWLREAGQIDRAPDGRACRAHGLVFDVTERKLAEEDLARSEERYRLAARAVQGVVWDWDLVRDQIHWTDGIVAVFGYRPDEVDPAGAWWIERIHPDDRERIVSGITAFVEGSAPTWSAEYRFRRSDGTYAQVFDRGFMMRSPDGRPLRMVGALQDVSDRLRLEAQLRQSQKMEAVGQLTGGVAHDFNNLLTVILGNAELLSEEPADPDLARTLSRMIVEAAEKGAELTRHLLAFGRRQSLTPVRLHLDEVVTGMLPLLRRTLGEHIELRTALARSRKGALVDRTLLESALLNLAVNAKDAMPQGGTLTLTTREAAAGPGQGGLPEEQGVVAVTVSDTGCGMSPEVLERVFEPFFTTKEVGKGSGLGLSMVYGFAQQSGGHVSIESEEGRGTSVTILLPAVAGEEELAAAGGPEPVRAAGRERVLLVEDEPQVLQFVSAQLVSLGYGVTAVSTGPDALELLQGGQRFDLLFSDVVLPKGMSGVELVRRAQALCPDLRVLLTSGYAEEAFEHHGRPDPATPILRKPYRRKELEQTLRAVLDQGAKEAPRTEEPAHPTQDPPSAQILELRARGRSPRLGGGRS